ncbi:hypothetical protein ACQ4LE_004382 [Meloidogyne hapla]
MATTYSPVKQELSNNSNTSSASQQQRNDRCEISRDVPNPLLDRRRSSGSIALFSNNEESQYDLVKEGEETRHQSFGAQNKNISNMRFSQEIPSYNVQNPIGNSFNVPRVDQQCGMLMPDKEHQKQPKKECAGFGIEEKPIHECDACGKRLCSSRSLKRHKSTCKRVKAVQGDFGSPPPPKPAENISENKVKEQQNIQKQIRKNSGASQVSNDNKNEKVDNLTQPVRQCSSEYINTQAFVLSQPPPQNCSFPSNNNSPIKFCNNSDSQSCGGLSSPPLNVQQQFYLRQPYPSAQIQVLQQENNSKKDVEINSKFTPITASDEPNKVSDVVDSVVAKLRLQNSGISVRTPTNCNTNPCNISTNNSQQQFFPPQQQHFNVPIEWNETNMPIQQFGEPQQSTPSMLYYTPVSQYQQQFQQRQQHISNDINNSRGIVPNQIEQTKCPQSKPLMPIQQHSWQTMNPPNPQIAQQQPKPITGAQRNNSGESTNLMPTMLIEGSSDKIIMSGRMGNPNEKFSCQYNNEQILKQQQSVDSQNIKKTECQTEKLQTSMGIKSTILSPPQSQQQQRPRADSGNTSKNVYRYLCPECDKPYSCRKNVKRHRISQHKVPAQEAQDGQIKRIRLTEADLQKDEGNKSKQTSKPKETKKEEIEKEQQNKLKEKELSRDEMSRHNSITSLTSPPHPHILQSPEQQNQKQTFVAPLQKQQQQQIFHQKQPSIIRDERQFPSQHPQTHQRHPYYLPYPPINQTQQEQRFVGQQHLDEQQQTFYEVPQHQQYIHGQQQQHQYNYQQHLIYSDSQQNKKYQQQYYGSQMLNYPPPPQTFQQQNQQQKIIMVQQQCNHQKPSDYAQQQQQPGPSNNNRLNNFYSQNNLIQYSNNYPQYSINNQNNEFPITYQEGYYQQQQQIEQQKCQFIPSVNYNNNSYAETLDCWEQIKSDVDAGPTVVDPDAIEMARIVEDLKRTEEVTEKRQKIIQQQQTIKRQQKQQNLQFRQLDTGIIVGSENADNSTGIFQQNSNIQRKAVELAEADTTFSPPSQPDDSNSVARQISQQGGSQQYQQKMIPLNHQILTTQQSPTTYHPQPLMSASHSTGQQQIFRFDIGSVNRTPKELKSVEQQQIDWNYQGGINFAVLPSQNKYPQQPPQQQPPQNLPLQSPSFSTNNPQEINKLTTQKSVPKNKSTKTTQQSNNGSFVCPACTKAYSTDYSLKRHRNVCPVLNVGKELGKGRGNSTRKRKNNSNNNNIPTSSTNNNENGGSLEKVGGGVKTDEQHQIDPDSTMNESPPDNAGGINSTMNRRISVSGTNTISAPLNNGDNVEEQNKHLQMQMATVIQL